MEFGPKKAWELIQDTDKLKCLLKEDITVADSFKRNKSLIAMSQIPSDIKKLILEQFQEIQESKSFFI